MPWWKNTNSSSSSSPKWSSSSSVGSPSSPRRNRRDFNFAWNHRRDAQPRLTRQRKLRHLSDIEVGGLLLYGGGYSEDSTPVSQSPISLDYFPARSSSSPVLLPQPLPLPEYCTPSSHRESGLRISPSNSEVHLLPSPEGNGTALCSSSTVPEVIGSRLSYQNAHSSPEHVGAPSAGSTFSHYRKVIQDPNAVEPVNFRLNFPTRSAPASGFSSPVLSPRRSSNVDFFTSAYMAPQGFQVWSAPEIPSSTEMITGFSPQTSPKKSLASPDHSPLYSPRIKSPILRSRNPSAPPSPLHPKMFPENSVSWHDSNGNANVHPLPLPPGAAVPLRSGFAHQMPGKAEVSPKRNQWQKGKLIGSGTFGNVYVATNRETGALCAMKEVYIIPDDPKSAESIKQLEQEIKLLSQLKHPNIVQYYGSEIIEDQFYIYLEYIYPGSINKYIREHCGAMTESVVRNFTKHILNGLAYLHSTNTMHRDIKGANLLVDASGVVKLADFGMAKHLSGAAAVLSLKGTPYWMAPEVIQAMLNKDIGYDLAIDIWSLGCTIIEMFTGEHPWSGLIGAAAMFKVMHESPHIPETLSPEGKDFLQLCFRRIPADRPTASMLLEHPFIRNTHHHNLHGSIQAFAGIKLAETTYSPRERTTSKFDSGVKGKQLYNGETSQSHPETSESAATHLSPRSTHGVVPSLFSHSNHAPPSPTGSSLNTLNGMHLVAGSHQSYALSKPHGKEVLNLF